WLDCDDVFRGGDKLKGLIKNAEESKAQSVFLNYLYQVEIVDNKIKNVLIEHLRERVIENTGVYKWIAPIHETLIEQVPTKKVENRECDVLHLSSVKRFEKALQRNLRSLELSILQTEIKDPRPIYYLGKAYYDLYTQKTRDMKHLDAAKGLFETYLHGSGDQEYLNKSGWGEERSQCWEYLSEIYRQKTEYNNAIKCCMNALIEDERFPSIFLNIAMSYLLKKEWGRALWWVKLAGSIPMPHTTLVSNPKDLQARTLEIVYHASLNSSMIDEAWAAAVKLKELLPENKEIQDRVSFVSELRQGRDLTKNLVSLAQHLDRTGQQELLKPLLLSAPRLIENNPIITNLRKNIIPPKIWGDDELCLYCGPAFTPWSPKQLDNPGECFVGGSEEAVIYLAKELNDLGWKVTVYADPAANEGIYDGVTYLPYYKFNAKDEFNIVVAWRRPSFVDENIKAKKIYIWCHDVQNQLDYTPERLDKITKVMVLSPWHRTNIPKVPDEKVLITGNGIKL
ncbi:MAG: hypothetical protein KJ725_20900, partial [Gammaproteobacteria bacterium]|nr:hypothetical protein [Gammaproteobacteria bacterium]